MVNMLYQFQRLSVPHEGRDAWDRELEAPPRNHQVPVPDSAPSPRRRRRRRRTAEEARAIAQQVEQYDREVTRGR